MPNIYWILGIFAFGVFTGWHAHTWYDGYMASKSDQQIIDERMIAEKQANQYAGATESKITQDQQDNTQQTNQLETDLGKTNSSADCALPDDGMHILQQAVAAHKRAR